MRSDTLVAAYTKQTEVSFDSEWFDLHSWYLLTGGFKFETRNVSTMQEYVPGSPDFVMTTAGFDYPLQRDPPILPNLAGSAIKDFGKADTLAKALVCLQATYMIGLCTSRLVTKLSISRLDINTSAHAFCALLMYFFWFGKPKDVRTRTSFRHEDSHRMAALMWMASTMSQEAVTYTHPLACQRQHEARACRGWWLPSSYTDLQSLGCLEFLTRSALDLHSLPST